MKLLAWYGDVENFLFYLDSLNSSNDYRIDNTSTRPQKRFYNFNVYICRHLFSQYFPSFRCMCCHFIFNKRTFLLGIATNFIAMKCIQINVIRAKMKNRHISQIAFDYLWLNIQMEWQYKCRLSHKYREKRTLLDTTLCNNCEKREENRSETALNQKIDHAIVV